MVEKIKAAISCAVQLICALVFLYAKKKKFSDDTDHMASNMVFSLTFEMQ